MSPSHRVGLTIVGVRGAPERQVEVWARRMLDALELRSSELSLVLCDDTVIRELNARFAGDDHATDVLAFAAAEARGPRAPGVLGDVVISIETARRQARARGATLHDEVAVLLAHGLLHLCGYDHRTRAEDRIMRERTDELVRAARERRRRSEGPRSLPRPRSGRARGRAPSRSG